jgi:hypothetical protein
MNLFCHVSWSKQSIIFWDRMDHKGDFYLGTLKCCPLDQVAYMFNYSKWSCEVWRLEGRGHGCEGQNWWATNHTDLAISHTLAISYSFSRSGDDNISVATLIAMLYVHHHNHDYGALQCTTGKLEKNSENTNQAYTKKKKLAALVLVLYLFK